MFTYTVFYFMVQYYGNEKFDENNEVWKFCQILNKLHSIKFIGFIIILFLIIICTIWYSPADQLWKQLAKCIYIYIYIYICKFYMAYLESGKLSVISQLTLILFKPQAGIATSKYYEQQK